MSDVAGWHREALTAARRIVAGVGPGQWSQPTPCEGWDVTELVSHLVGGNLWAVELAAGRTIEAVGSSLDGDLLGDDPLAAYDRSAEAAARAFERPGALEAPCAVSYGPVPGEVYAGHRFIDVLVHGWDLAVATGQDPVVAPALVDACLSVVEPQLDLLQASGAFGNEVPVPEGADPQARLLASLGRRT